MMTSGGGNGNGNGVQQQQQQQVSVVPPGFRFHPTDEELLYYYLRKKVSYESIDLDVIREVDLNKLEPWDLKDKCRIGSGPQNEWYFFSHKDKKYPTGTRTNRATAAGFWKATGRDKVIHLTNVSKRIGMRKTLVFYTGRAPHGQKTDWIMHEYRLDDVHHNSDIQEEGWVVCRVFKKKTHTRSFEPDEILYSQEEHHLANVSNNLMGTNKQNLQPLYQNHDHDHNGTTLYHHGSMQLPQLFSSESSSSAAIHHHNHPHPHPHHHNPISFLSPSPLLSNIDMECSHNLLRLTSSGTSGFVPPADWSFLDKLLTSSHHQTTTMDHHHHRHHHQTAKCNPSSSISAQALDHVGGPSMSVPRLFPFQYLGCETSTDN